jgi:hypothetical protein
MFFDQSILQGGTFFTNGLENFITMSSWSSPGSWGLWPSSYIVAQYLLWNYELQPVMGYVLCILLLKKPGHWWWLRVSLVRNLINMIFQEKLWGLKLVHSCNSNWANQSFLLTICQARFIPTCWYQKLEVEKSRVFGREMFSIWTKVSVTFYHVSIPNTSSIHNLWEISFNSYQTGP